MFRGMNDAAESNRITDKQNQHILNSEKSTETSKRTSAINEPIYSWHEM